MKRHVEHFYGTVLATILIVASSISTSWSQKVVAPKNAKAAVPAQAKLRAKFTDGSTLRLTLLDTQLRLNTPYGELQIPVSDIQQLEFATRNTPSTQKAIDAAVKNLRSKQFNERERGTAAILTLREKAYSTLLHLIDDADPEVASRAKKLMKKLKDTVAEDLLIVRPSDVVHTRESRIAGRIEIESLKVNTEPFGEQQVKLHNLLSIGGKTDSPKNVMLNPGNLSRYHGQVGKKLYFKVTGLMQNAGGFNPGFGGGFAGALYGTDKFTTDSALAMAAVHAGALKPGETGVVRVTILGPQQSFAGSVRNGVRSSAYGQYPSAYKVQKVAK